MTIVTISKNHVVHRQPPQLTTTQGNAITILNGLLTKFDLPVFPPMQNQTTTKIRGIIFNQNRGKQFDPKSGSNFNQDQVYQPPINQPPTFQAPPYQAPAPAHPTPGVSKSDFDHYVKANDAVMQNMQNQMANITDLLTKIVNSNTASTSGSGSLPSNTIANPKGDVKAITTPNVFHMMDLKLLLLKRRKMNPRLTMDTVQNHTENIQPPVVT
ncbi:hypothetical protein Tco_1311887 [Tanacetum coccineum]